MKFTSFIRVVSLCFLSWGAFFQSSQAQCPSVAGTGDPAVIMLNLYGMPHAAFLNTPFEDLNGGVTAGVQLGAIFSPEFQLVSGAEMDWVKRSPASLGTSSIAFNYEAFILEIPLDLRMRFHKGRDQEAFFILGAGFVLANVKESNNPETTTDELLWETLYGRLGFEHTITVNNTFNILWGIITKVDPIGIANQEYSPLVGTYYAGLKLGIQLGL